MYTKPSGVPIVELPGYVMYYKAGTFDLIVPRITAGKEVTSEDIIRLGHGGCCEGCAECRYPVCALERRHSG